MTVLNISLSIFALIIIIPLWMLVIELLVVSFSEKMKIKNYDHAIVPFTILIPAHNEELIIDRTLSKLISNKIDSSNILVVADNCADNTAQIVRDMGGRVIERNNLELKGKGYALDYGLSYLKQLGYNGIVVILDADCEMDARSLSRIASMSAAEYRPIQAVNIQRIPAESSIKQRIAGFAWLVKNKLRPSAIETMGLPVTLTGTGMAFPLDLLLKVQIGHGNIVEDMQLGIDLSIIGYPPRFCPDAVVYSDFPSSPAAQRSQRTRWEHGHLLTILNQVPKLLKKAVVKKNLSLFLLALDIAIPPLALLMIVTFLFIIFFGGLNYFGILQHGFYIVLISLISLTLTMLITWYNFGRDFITFKNLFQIPIYIFSKLWLYTGFFCKKQKAWVKTSREKHKGP